MHLPRTATIVRITDLSAGEMFSKLTKHNQKSKNLTHNKDQVKHKESKTLWDENVDEEAETSGKQGSHFTFPPAHFLQAEINHDLHRHLD